MARKKGLKIWVEGRQVWAKLGKKETMITAYRTKNEAKRGAAKLRKLQYAFKL